MSGLIYKAIPGNCVVNIAGIKESVRFHGNDAKVIVIENASYGSSLVLEEFESLEEIRISSPGVVISFNKFPSQTIRISGTFDEVRITDNQEFYCIHKHVIRIEQSLQRHLPQSSIWGAVITRDPNIESKNMDAVMLHTNGVKDLEINEEWSHISVVGDEILEKISVNGKREISKLVIHKAPSLTSLNIRKQVLNCSISRCPKINSVAGFGNKLDLGAKTPAVKDDISIGGFWLEVPAWYKGVVGNMRIPHLDSVLSYDDIHTCMDMGGTMFILDPYQGPGGHHIYSSVFGTEMDFGIEIPRLLELIEENPIAGLTMFIGWCDSTLSFFDQYIAMRIIASLITRGFDSKEIVKIRNRILRANNEAPIVEQTVANTQQRSNKYRDLSRVTDLSGSMWNIPQHSVMPFNRVDLEIWLHTNLDSSFLGIDSLMKNRQPGFKVYTYFKTNRAPHRNPLVRFLLISGLGAAKSNNRIGKAENKLTKLIQKFYSDEFFVSDPLCCEFLIHHYSDERMNDKKIVAKLIDHILNIRLEAWKRAALLVALIHKTNSTLGRIALKKLASNKEITLTEARILNAVSLLGTNAFETGKVVKPEWPYLVNWQMNNKMRG